jgi:serine/threonine-protein kinase
VILYQLLTGHPPFCADKLLELIQQVQTMDPIPPRQWQPKIPRDLETICLRCLAKEPRHRYATAAALAEDLERFLDGRSILARPVGPLARGWRWCQRKPVLAGLVATILFLLLMLAVGGPMMALQQMQLRELAETKERVANIQKDATGRYASMLTEQQDKEIVRLIASHNARAIGVKEMSRFAASNKLDLTPLNRRLLQQEVSTLGALARQRELNPDIQLAYAQWLHELALMDEIVGEWKLATRELKQAEEIASHLTVGVADSPIHPSVLAQIHQDSGSLRDDLGFRSQAENDLRDALALRRQLMDEAPRDTTHVKAVAIILVRLSGLLRETNRQSDAGQFCMQALELATKVADDSPTDLQARYVMAMCQLERGELVLQAGRDIAAAEALFRNALALSQSMVGDFSVSREHELLLARIRIRLGEEASKMGRVAEAEKHYREAAALQEQLAVRYPFNVHYRVRLAVTQQLIGALLAKRGSEKTAQVYLSRSVAGLKPIVANEPRLALARKALRDAYRCQSELMKKPGQARKRLRLVHLARDLEDSNLRNLCIADALRLADSKDFLKASVEAFELAGEKDLSCEENFKLACVFAGCAANSKDDAELHDRFVKNTMDMLTACRAMGFYDNPANRSRIRKVPAFDWLRDENNYRAYLPDQAMDEDHP